jgi:hypothetical protein
MLSELCGGETGLVVVIGSCVVTGDGGGGR